MPRIWPTTLVRGVLCFGVVTICALFASWSAASARAQEAPAAESAKKADSAPAEDAFVPETKAETDEAKPKSGEAPKRASAAKEGLAAKQEHVADRFRELERLLLRMAELTAPTDPRRAALLRQAVAQSKDRDLEHQFEQLIALLRDERLAAVVRSQGEVHTDLVKLLELLLSEDRSKRIESEKQKVREYIKRVNKIIKEQKSLQNETEREDDPRELADPQKELADKTGELSDDLKKDKKPDAKKSDEKEGDKKEGDEPKSDEKKNDSEKKADEKTPEGDAKDKPTESDKKPSEKSDAEKAKDADKKEGDKEEAEKSDAEREKEKQDQEKKEAEKKEQEKKDAEKKDAEKGDKKPGDMPPESSEDSKSESPSSKEESESQPSDNPAQKRLQQAQKRMQEAQQKLAEAKKTDAKQKQAEAIKELEQAKAELEEILRQLREEEMARTLAMLEARFRKMLDAQVEVFEGTVRLSQVPEAERDRDDEIEAGRMSRREAEIAIEADRALDLMRDDGSAVAFPEAVVEIRDDMVQVRDLLAESKVGELTQGVEKDIIAALEEMIAALQKAQKDMQNKNKSPSESGGEGNEPPLVDSLAELRMIRALQMRVNTRTKRYAEMTKTEQVDQPELLRALKELAEREQRIHQVTRDIVVGRNR